MKRHSFFFQLYFLILLALAVPTVVLTTFNSRYIFAYAEERASSSLRDNTLTVSRSLERILFDIIKSTLRLIESSSFRGLRGLDSYADLNRDYVSILKAMEAGNAFSDLLLNETLIHSACFVVEGGGYIVSSDKGIVTPDNYRDLTWLIGEVRRNSRINGFWVGRKMNLSTVNDIQGGLGGESYEDIFSFVYPVRTIASSIRGTIVINLYEKQLNRILNPVSTEGGGFCFLTDREGRILIHPDPAFLGRNARELGLDWNGTEDRLSRTATAGNWVTYLQPSQFDDWVYVNRTSLRDMMIREAALRRKMVLLAVLLLLTGVLFIRLTAGKLLKPMRDLVRYASDIGSDVPGGEKNELEYLQSVFMSVREKSRGLVDVIREREGEKRTLLVTRCLEEGLLEPEEREELSRFFTHPHFLLILWERDGAEEADAGSGRLMQRVIEEHMMLDRGNFFGLGDRRARVTLVMNLPHYDQTETPLMLRERIGEARRDFYDRTGRTLSAGVSGVHCGLEKLAQCRLEAGEALRGKLLTGKGSLLFWREEMEGRGSYFYPHVEVEKIINYLHSGDMARIEDELGVIEGLIRGASYVSYDNVLLIYNQIIGITLKFLVERNINTARIFGHCGNVYGIISRKETLEEINEALLEFFRTIRGYLSRNESDPHPDNLQRILSYIELNYRGDIDFETMADRLGISYSYMRKIIKEMTGKSLLDCINGKRIEAAKHLLLDTDGSLEAIARSTGYRNSQSLGRFFKKYEGITPSEFRRLYGPESE